MKQLKIAVVIPSYKVKKHILAVIDSIGMECSIVLVVDDCCPDQSGRFVQENTSDTRVTVLFNERNLGVGGAVMTGYRAALSMGADIIVKIDGDGQMDPSLIMNFIEPLVNRDADYVKGNRFHSVYNVRKMPGVRLFGNAVLSFITKLSSGYWSIFDPTNGYTAIHASALSRIELKNISERYFFESDMMVNLGGVRAVIRDIPMEAVYNDEISGLKIKTVIFEFLFKHLRELGKRIVYSYFLRDFNMASINLFVGIILTLFGVIFGCVEWSFSNQTNIPATSGTVLVATLPIILGFQLLLSFLTFDIANEPKIPLQRLPDMRQGRDQSNL